MQMKTLEREQARALRRQGQSVKEICRALGVSKSSVSLWVRDIELTPEQLASLHQRRAMSAAQGHGARGVKEKYLALRKQYQEEGRAKAHEGDPLHLAGCMLYWAEGRKERNSLSLINSDASMLLFYTRFVRESLKVPECDIRIRINCYTNNGITIEEIETYWLGLLKLPQTALGKSVINRQPTSSQQKGRKLLYGVCAVDVHKTRYVQHVLGAIQEYTGIDKPEWLL
jgi:hypothetical protein